MDVLWRDVVNLDAELRQYVETALWSSNADHLDPEGTGAEGHMDDHFDYGDVSPETLSQLREELSDFLGSCKPVALAHWVESLGEGSVGHDFWLTRNGHGAGFWDRFYRDHPGEMFGRHLTDNAKTYGESYCYAGDDGRVYFQ